MTEMTPAPSTRYARVLRLHAEGMSCEAIGRVLGVSGVRAGQLLRLAQEWELRQFGWMHGLGTRASRALRRFPSRENFLTVLEKHADEPFSWWLPGVGSLTEIEIRHWLRQTAHGSNERAMDVGAVSVGVGNGDQVTQDGGGSAVFERLKG